MSAKIFGDLKELKNITNEIKRLNIKLKELRLNKSEIEDRIKEYLEEEDQVGVKFENMIIMTQQKTKRSRMGKKEKEASASAVLEGMGIENPQEALKQIMESMKGEEELVSSLQVKETKGIVQ